MPSPETETETETILEFSDVSKRYGTTQVTTLQSLNLSLHRGEFFSLIGPSGCGKTTTLKLVSGLEYPTGGRILLEGSDISRIPTHRRPVHTVFQSYALFPHMTVYENIAFGLKQTSMAKSERKRRIDEAIDMVNLGENQAKKPDELSGGMQQRVALARSLVLSPKILLLDEPLGALDLKLRQQMQLQLKRIQRETGVTFLYVTHDQEEAFSMSDRIGFMHAGSLIQVDRPAQMYHKPKNALVADFVGSTNIFPIESCANGQIATSHFTLPTDVPRAEDTDLDSPAVVVLRPEKLSVAAGDEECQTDTAFRGRVIDLSFKGAFTAVIAGVGEQEIVASIADPRRASAFRPGDDITIGFNAEDAWVCAEVPPAA